MAVGGRDGGGAGDIAAGARGVVTAHDDEDLCLRVDPGLASLRTAETVGYGFEKGWIEVLEVVSCGGEGEEAPAPPVPVFAGDWRVSDIDRDPITDRRVAAAYLDAESGSDVIGTPHRLHVRCENGKARLYLEWNNYPGSDYKKNIKLRVDGGKVKTERWIVSTDGTVVFYPGNAIKYIKSLFGKSELVARTTPYNEGASTAIFTIAGNKDAMANVRKTCRR